MSPSFLYNFCTTSPRESPVKRILWWTRSVIRHDELKLIQITKQIKVFFGSMYKLQKNMQYIKQNDSENLRLSSFAKQKRKKSATLKVILMNWLPSADPYVYTDTFYLSISTHTQTHTRTSIYREKNTFNTIT